MAGLELQDPSSLSILPALILPSAPTCTMELVKKAHHQFCVLGRLQEHKLKVEERFPRIQPYRRLYASRPKLTAAGEWPLESFLDDVLRLPFVEPAVLARGLPVN